jgi:hypothetical protein
MADHDHVFARFHDNHAPSEPRHELLSIRRKGSSQSSRTVEVVHVRSGKTPSKKDQPAQAAGVRAATWTEGFPIKTAPVRSPFDMPPEIEAPQPTVHVMPMWEPSQAEPEAAPPQEAGLREQVSAPKVSTTKVGGRRRQAAGLTPGSSADPFDLDDDGANCLRCGYRVEPARERRALLTCAKCG